GTVLDERGVPLNPWRVVPACLICAAACDTTVHEPLVGLPDAAPTGKCLEAEQHSDFAWIRDNVFRTSFAPFSSCHQGGTPPGMLALTAAHAFTDLVNAPAYELATWKRVVPYRPERSFLLVKLGAMAGPSGLDGGLMPPNSPAICTQKIAAVTRWIAE